jgi:hypothetical protein
LCFSSHQPPKHAINKNTLVWGKNIPGGKTSSNKGPEVRKQLAHPRNSKKASVAKAEKAGESNEK